MFQAVSYLLNLAVKVHCCKLSTWLVSDVRDQKNCTMLRGAWCGEGGEAEGGEVGVEGKCLAATSVWGRGGVVEGGNAKRCGGT